MSDQRKNLPSMAVLPTNWHRADVVAAVHRRDTSLAELARGNGKSESALRVALTHPRKPSNEIIAAFLGKSLHDIWPEWFDRTGRLRSRKASRARRGRSTQNVGKKLSVTGEAA
ncbi:MAG: helix-turn-helix domain-containing protein [Gammaproteobacteria bacterium]